MSNYGDYSNYPGRNQRPTNRRQTQTNPQRSNRTGGGGAIGETSQHRRLQQRRGVGQASYPDGGRANQGGLLFPPKVPVFELPSFPTETRSNSNSDEYDSVISNQLGNQNSLYGVNITDKSSSVFKKGRTFATRADVLGKILNAFHEKSQKVFGHAPRKIDQEAVEQYAREFNELSDAIESKIANLKNTATTDAERGTADQLKKRLDDAKNGLNGRVQIPVQSRAEIQPIPHNERPAPRYQTQEPEIQIPPTHAHHATTTRTTPVRDRTTVRANTNQSPQQATEHRQLHQPVAHATTAATPVPDRPTGRANTHRITQADQRDARRQSAGIEREINQIDGIPNLDYIYDKADGLRVRIGNLGRDLLAYNPTLTEEFVRGEKTRLTNLLEGKVATAERRLQHTARPTPTYSQPSYHQQQPVASSAARRNPDALRSQQAESGRNFFSELHNQIEGLYDQVEALSGDAKRQKELNGYVTTDTKNEIKKLLSEASDLLEIVGGETPASYSDIISQADELLSDEPQTSTPPYNPDYRPAGLQKSPSLWAAGDWASDEISKIKSQLAKLSKPGGDPAFKLLALKEVISELDDLVRPTSREGLEEQKGQVDSLKQDAETLKDTLEKDSVVANLQSRYNTIASLPSGDEQYLLAIELNQDLNPEGYTKLDKEQKAELDNIAGELNKIIESYDSFFDSPALQASSIQDQKIAALEQLIKPLQGYQYNSSVGKEASKLLNSKAKPTNFTGLTRAQTIKLNQLRDTLAEIVRQNSDAQSPAPLQRHDSIATTATRWEGAISYEANESQTEFRKLRESYSRLAENLHDIDKGNPNNFDTLIEIRKELNSLRNKVRELAQHSDSFNSQQHNSQQGEIVRLQRNIDDSIADATKAISNIEQYLLGGR